MNLLNSGIIKYGKNIHIEKTNDGLLIKNNSGKKARIVFNKLINFNRQAIIIDSKVDVFTGKGADIKIINRKFKVSHTFPINELVYEAGTNKVGFFGLSIHSNSEILIKVLDYKKDLNNEKDKKINETFTNKNILICPGYPSLNNKYLFGFVHTRIKEYKEKNIEFDVVFLNEKKYTSFYEFEGIKVCKTDYFNLRNIMLDKNYENIVVHFCTSAVAQILDAVNTYESKILIFTHGSDILYRDMNILTKKYFESEDYKAKDGFIECKDRIIKRYNKMNNVTFIFGSTWAKLRSEEQNNIKYNNFEIIPTFIDDKIFEFHQKTEDQRKKIIIVRKFDNISTYSIDLSVRAILELSKKDYFNELEFNIYGDGDFYDELLAPLKQFKNVNMYRKFLTHEEIARAHKENGIALFSTRYETLGVSAAEAAMSGLVVVSNDVAAVPEIFDKEFNTLAPKEDYISLANIIDRLYNNPKEFVSLSKKIHETILEKLSYKNTIEKDIELINKKVTFKYPEIKNIDKKPLLSIVIPSYNCGKFLINSVMSLVNSELAGKLEILIINDGSKDNTLEVGKFLEKTFDNKIRKIVKIIDKENGGHGSTINKGIELAMGKYFKLMDGDDYFDTDSLTELIKVLEKEDSDIILNNYVEDLAINCELNPIRHYEYMKPGFVYDLEELCYDNYGFTEWGPLLSTSTFKTKILKEANFKISEKCFYVDMELNSIAFVQAKNVVYYPIDIYYYYIGRIGQSISADSFKRNYKNHEHVIFRILNDIYTKEMSEKKKQYLKEKILIPLIQTQYIITLEYFKSSKEFKNFNNELKKYPEFYFNDKINDKKISKYRKTNGQFKKTINLFVKIKHLIFRRNI